MMYVDCRVGRLIETRWASPISGVHVDRFIGRVAALMSKTSDRYVVFADLEQATILPPEWIDRVVEMLRSDNPKIERNGLLLGNSATFSMQVERMIRQAENPARRTFRDLDELNAWITPVLTDEEIIRCVEFRASTNETLRASEQQL